ncbi:bacterio-opsin activator domain-containing protein [Natrarchaeobaculum aegyptiacum]|uniref:Histidine kinase n=1 Tax=Natrarchaeobaculum aegyptiacum TaxID=745377 RepID=A0A2Z2HU99_9EURY|nr:bacterio-opsin activator domain-containing protein [Natrarchaeobaculum aegyptiacum]ARS90809.1 histidine kinase [Natrarchaeobaculum aegyptiacum]
MDAPDDLPAAALETFPLTVAVVDDAGDILLTNRAWREFGRESDPESADESVNHVGVNYVATAAMAEDDDEYAERAVAGLEAVLSGDRETFAMEYPCHTPDRKQWFLMRATSFSIDDDRYVSVAHLEITERKLAELAAEEAAERARERHQTLEHVVDRIDGLVRDVTDAAVGAGTRDEVERRVVRRLVDTEPYVLAWIGRVDVTSRRVSPREWATTSDLGLEDGDLTLGDDDSHPAVEALETGDPVVIDDLESFAEADQWWPVGASTGFHSVAALPLTYGDVTYGVLVLFADDPNAFADRELLVLESLAGTIATAMNAIEARRMLTTEAVVEIELEIDDPGLFATQIADALDRSVRVRGLASEDGTPIAFVYVDDAGVDAGTVSGLEGIANATTLVTYEDGTLLEVALEGGLVPILSERGAVLQGLDAADGQATLVLELANGQAARAIYDVLEDRYDVVDLRSYHERERPARTPQDLAGTLEQRLTDRQQMALRKAYLADYFEWPRNVSGEELAESMGISRSTFHQHLRSAQQKLLEELYDGDTVSRS